MTEMSKVTSFRSIFNFYRSGHNLPIILCEEDLMEYFDVRTSVILASLAVDFLSSNQVFDFLSSSGVFFF